MASDEKVVGGFTIDVNKIPPIIQSPEATKEYPIIVPVRELFVDTFIVIKFKIRPTVMIAHAVLNKNDIIYYKYFIINLSIII